MSAAGKGRSYVEVVRQKLQHYTFGLLRENEKLRAAASALESEKQRLDTELGSVRKIMEQHDELCRTVETFEQTRTTMMFELARATYEKASAREELDRLRNRTQEVEQANQLFAAQYHQIERHSGNLSNLYVASYQLHSSVERQAVLNTIQEIVINLIGSEEVAIFQLDEFSGQFQLAASFGLDEERVGPFAIGSGPIGGLLADGELFIDDTLSSQNNVTACVPLKIGDRIIGAIVVFRLLDHKGALEQVDRELFELLSVHASTALYCSTLHETTIEAVH